MRRALAAAAVVSLAVAGSALAATAFTPAKHARPPLLIDHGYAHLPIRLIAFVPKTYPDRTELVNFVTKLGSTGWWQAVSSAYRIPQTISEPWKTIVASDMPILGSSTSSTEYQNWVYRKLDRLGAAHDRSGYLTIYLLFIPCKGSQSLDGLGCESHHQSLSPTKQDALALVTTDPAAATDSKTLPASHEFAESATDTGGGWNLTTAHKTTPWVDAPPWVEDEGSGAIESADMSAGDRWYEQGTLTDSSGNRIVYEYQRIFADTAARTVADPAVPSAPYPYYNVYASGSTDGWYRVAPGRTVTVHLNGWSTANFGKWNVSAKVVGGRSGTNWNSTCRLLGSSWTGVGNGTPLTLSLVTSSSSQVPSWCVVKLSSSLPSSSPFATHADDYHVWYIGFVVKD